MNSEKKIYEELLKEHPELKESKVDIQEVIFLMQQMNPDIVADDTFKISLKKRLDAITAYNPQKNQGFMGFLKFFIPVFSFGFAVFGFLYFSEDLKQNTQQNIETVQLKQFQDESFESDAAEMMMLSDMPEGSMGKESMPGMEVESEPVGLMKMSRMAIPDSTQDEPETISDEMGGDTLPMLFSTESIMESSENNYGEETSTLINSGAYGNSETQNGFEKICGEYNGGIKNLDNGDRECVLEEKKCLESTYIEQKCFEKK